MKNIIPQKPSITDLTLLGSDKARVSHSSLVDYDAAYIICYVYVVTIGTLNYTSSYASRTIFRVAKEDFNSIIVNLPAATATQEYVFEVAVLDELADGITTPGSSITNIDREGNSLGTVSNTFVTNRTVSALNISDPIRLSVSRGAYITSVQEVIPDSFSNSAPSYFNFELEPPAGSVSHIVVQAGTGYNGSSVGSASYVTIYSNIFKSSLNISSGLVVGSSYVFRVQTVFTDGSASAWEYLDATPSTTNITHPLVQKTYGVYNTNPTNFNQGNISFEAFTSWDGTPTYELFAKWTYSATSPVRHYEVQYIKDNAITDATDASTRDWTNPTVYTVASSSDRVIIPAIQYGQRYAFRFRAVGWGGVSSRYSSWVYKKVAIGNDPAISFDIVPNQHTAPVGTNIQVNDAYIRAYKDWGGAGQAVTFSVDAANGNVTIGESGEFLYDAVTSTLAIDGTAVVNDIVGASFVMDWLGGVAPSLRTANKTGFADGGQGLWAGYTDNSTFKFDIGDDSANIRWDGSNLTISGGVTIDLPSDPSSLPPGSIGYTTVSMAATNNIVIFDGATNTIKEDVSIAVNVSTNGSTSFIDNLVWEVLDADDNDITSTALSAGTSNANKFINVTAANNVLKTYDKIKVRVYFKPDAGTTYDTANIKDYTTIGKVKTYDSIAGLEEPFYVYLTNDVQAVPVDENEQNPSLAGATGSVKIYQGSTDLSSSPNTTYSVSNADGCTVSLVGNVFTVTAIPLSGGVPTKDTYNIEFNVNYDPDSNGGVDYATVFSLFVSKQGATGNAGQDGSSSRYSNTFETAAEQALVGNHTYGTSSIQTGGSYGGSKCLLLSSSYDPATVTMESSGDGNSVALKIDNSLAAMFSGKIVVVEFYAKQGGTTPSSEFQVAYSSNSIGNSGFYTFTPTSSWTKFSFEYNSPIGGTGNNTDDYIIIDADTSGSGGEILLDNVSVYIKPEKGEKGDVPTITNLGNNQYRISNGVDPDVIISDGVDGLPPTITRNDDGTYTIDNGVDPAITISDGAGALPYDISPAQFGGGGNIVFHHNYTLTNNVLSANTGEIANDRTDLVFIHPTLGNISINRINILTCTEGSDALGTGDFYIMYTHVLPATRFPGVDHVNSSSFIPVRYKGGKWWLVTNSPSNSETVEITLEATDCFVGKFSSHVGSSKIDTLISYINYQPVKNIDYFDGVDGAYVSTVFRVVAEGVTPSTPTGGSLSIDGVTGALNETPPNSDAVACTLEPTYAGTGVEWKSTTRYYKNASGNWVHSGWSDFVISTKAGANAKILTLSASALVFKFDKDGNALNGSDSITFTCKTENLTGTPVFSTSPNVTLSGSGNTRTLSIANFGSNQTVAITASLGGYSDTVRVVRVQDGPTGSAGEDSYTVILTNEAHTIGTDVNGNNQNLTGTGTQIRVFRGTTQLTPVITTTVGSLTTDQFDVRASNKLAGMNFSVSGNNFVISDATSGPSSDTHQVTYTVYIRTPSGPNISLVKLQTFTKAKQGTQGPTGVGQQGTRAPVFIEGSTNQDPTTNTPWAGGTGSTAYSVFTNIMGAPIAYDMLTLYNSSNVSLVDTKMWNGSTWEDAVKINGNIIADGTIGARALVADEGFFEEINVNTIYNHGGNQNNYKMKIDFVNGAIHIRGGN